MQDSGQVESCRLPILTKGSSNYNILTTVQLSDHKSESSFVWCQTSPNITTRRRKAEKQVQWTVVNHFQKGNGGSYVKVLISLFANAGFWPHRWSCEEEWGFICRDIHPVRHNNCHLLMRGWAQGHIGQSYQFCVYPCFVWNMPTGLTCPEISLNKACWICRSLCCNVFFAEHSFSASKYSIPFFGCIFYGFELRLFLRLACDKVLPHPM